MKFILLYPFAALASLAIDIACRFFLNWIVVLFADKDGNLPRCLYWFQTFDATLYQGQISRERDVYNGSPSDTWRQFIAYPLTAWQRYLNRALWLFRNSAYGFDYYLFGIDFKPENWRCVKYEKGPDRDIEIHIGDGFNIKYRGKWGSYKLGWKASNVYDRASNSYPRKWGDAGRIPLTISVNPFKRKKPVLPS